MDTLITPQEKMTDGQIAKVKELLEAALRKSGLGGDSVQRVIEAGGDFQREITSILQKLGELPYANEALESTYGYPEGWHPKSVPDQLAVLQQIEEFRALDASQVNKMAEIIKDFFKLPEGADGLFVIPKPSKVACSYNDATVLMTKLMAQSREDWFNYQEGELGPKYLRLTGRTQRAIAKLEKETPGDFLVIPVQTGLRHRGRSVRRARVMFSSNEFGLGPYAVSTILLVNPERLQKDGDLSIYCAGCEYFSSVSNLFDSCPCFFWGVGRPEFSCIGASGHSHRDCGSASGFLG